MTPPDGDTTRRWLDREPHTPYEARAGLTYYKQLGYIPTDKTDEACLTHHRGQLRRLVRRPGGQGAGQG